MKYLKRLFERKKEPEDDGPEVEVILFFKYHPSGILGGLQKCLHEGV